MRGGEQNLRFLANKSLYLSKLKPGQLAATADLAVSADVHSVHDSLRRADKDSSGKS